MVGPQWGHTWVPPSMTLNFVWPLRQPLAEGKDSTSWHVTGVSWQFLTDFRPEMIYKENYKIFNDITRRLT